MSPKTRRHPQRTTRLRIAARAAEITVSGAAANRDNANAALTAAASKDPTRTRTVKSP